jgi:hypothetical protein
MQLKLQTKLAILKTLLNKDFSLWTDDETARFENRLTLEIEIVSVQLSVVELYLEKPFHSWTEDEKDQYGSKEQLRKKEEQLRKIEELLLQLKIKERGIYLHSINSRVCAFRRY